MRMRATTLLAAIPLALFLGTAAAQAQQAACATPKDAGGFLTCADIDAAKQEGQVVLNTSEVDTGNAQMVKKFNALFPQITVSYARVQSAPGYAKLLAERKAGVYSTDVLAESEFSLALDFQKQNGFMNYLSPELATYDAAYKSSPAGYFGWGAVSVGGIAYNPQVVPPDQAPKSWKDLLDPRWANGISVKDSTAGLTYMVWYLLNKQLGPDYWTQFAKQKPKAYNSYVQQFDAIVNHTDTIAAMAQYNGYVDYKKKGAPIAFVYPTEGLPTAPVAWGVVDKAPHPEAAKLFIDWFFSQQGQQAHQDAFSLPSVRKDVQPPAGIEPLSNYKLLFPTDWGDFVKSRPPFAAEWDNITGMQ